ncbi:MAG: TraR/DksA C4-type zinc finger protein [Elusimicrobiota bacterium]
MNQKELKELKKLLVEKKDDLLHMVTKNRKEEGVIDVGDEADAASDSLEKELSFELTDNERQMLERIEAALRKVEKNIYGTCEKCAEKISFERLKAMPYARYCITCQSKLEIPKR